MTQATQLPQDFDALLLRERIVLVAEALDAPAAARVVARLAYLDAVEPGEPIWLYVSGPGGSPGAVLAVADAVKALRSPAHALAVGDLRGTAAALLAAVPRGRREALPSARVTWSPGDDRAAELAAAIGLDLPEGPIDAARALALGLVGAVRRAEVPEPPHRPR